MKRILFFALALLSAPVFGQTISLSQSAPFVALKDRVVAVENGKFANPLSGMSRIDGNGAQPHEGGLGLSTRPGYNFLGLKVASHYPNPAVVNQQDSMLYIEGHVPNVSMPLDNEFAGLRINMSSAATDATASLRGLHMTVTGEGGAAKLRALRATTIGLNGHTGLTIGGLFTATRTGTIPLGFGADGQSWVSGQAGPYINQDYALYAAVGPGIRGTLLLGGQAGKERPQTGIQQARGNQALLPEIAFMDIHGGGNGKLVRVLQDEESSTEIASWERDGKLRVPSIRSNQSVSALADDSAMTITPPSGNGFIRIWLDNALGGFVDMQFRTATGGGAGAELVKAGSLATLGTTGVVLTGTTGVDGRLTVAVVNNVIYVENRIGANRNIGYAFITN